MVDMSAELRNTHPSGTNWWPSLSVQSNFRD